MPTDYVVRAMRESDVAEVEQLTDRSLADLSRRTHRTGWPEPRPRDEAAHELWASRLAHLLGTDPGGCWVAENRSGLLGAAVGLRRDLSWLLSAYFVSPEVQGRGVGTQLLDAASRYGAGCLRAMVAVTEDVRAVRRYRLAGFTLHPTLLLHGTVARSALPVVRRVREGSHADLDLLDSVDRQVRDAAHGPDHRFLIGRNRLLVVDRTTGSGYAYLSPRGGVQLLAATNRRTATDLLWESLAASTPGEPVTVPHLSAANEWAFDVGLAARLELHTRGYLGLRGTKPPAPYLPSPHFL